MWLRRKVRSARRSSENRNKQFLYDLAGAISAQAPSSKQVTRTASGGNRADGVFLSEDQKGDERRTDAGDGEQKAAQKRNEGSFKRRGRCCSTFSRGEAVSCFCFFLLLSAKSLGQNKQRPQRHAPPPTQNHSSMLSQPSLVPLEHSGILASPQRCSPAIIAYVP